VAERNLLAPSFNQPSKEADDVRSAIIKPIYGKKSTKGGEEDKTAKK